MWNTVLYNYRNIKLMDRTANLKVDIKGSFDSLECRACKTDEENQKHIWKCETLNQNQIIYKF